MRDLPGRALPNGPSIQSGLGERGEGKKEGEIRAKARRPLLDVTEQQQQQPWQ